MTRKILILNSNNKPKSPSFDGLSICSFDDYNEEVMIFMKKYKDVPSWFKEIYKIASHKKYDVVFFSKQNTGTLEGLLLNDVNNVNL